MEPASPFRQIFRFGLFEADSARSTLTRGGVRVKIQEQPLRVLLMLLERAGEIVTREELRHRLWPGGTFVDFDGSLNVTLKKLRTAIDDDSDNPCYVETVPRRGYRFIAPVSVSEAIAASAGGNAAESATAVHSSNSPSIRRTIYVALAISALVIVALLVTPQTSWYRKAEEANRLTLSAHASAPISIRKSIAVLGFQNVTGKKEDAWLGTAFAEMLNTELASGGRLRLVSGEEVANLWHSAPWPMLDTLDQETSERVGRALNSDVLVVGSYTALGKADGGQLRLDVRLQDAKSGEILTETSETGNAQNLFPMVSSIGGKLRGKLGVLPIESQQEASAVATLPSNPEAARLYSLGLAKLRGFDYAAAQALFEQAIEAEPKFPFAHTMLARAEISLGYDDKAKAEAKDGVDLGVSAKLARIQQMEIEATYYEALGQRDKAAAIYLVLFELFPDSIDYGLQLATLQLRSYQPDASLQTIEKLRHLPSPARDDPGIDLLEAAIVGKKDVEAKYHLYQSAAAKAQAQGKKLQYAMAEKYLCGENRQHLQTPPECVEAYNIFLAAGNRAEAAAMIQVMAELDRLTGHDQSAIPLYRRSLKIFEETGNREEIGVALNNYSLVLEKEGQWSQAEIHYREAKQNFQAVNDWANTAVAMSNIADMEALRGHLSEAALLYQNAWELMDSSQRGRSEFIHLGYDSMLLALGEMLQARTNIEAHVKSLRDWGGDQYQLANAISILGDVEKASGNLDKARQNYREALDILKKVNFPTSWMASTFADLSVAEGNPNAAETLLQPAIAEYEKEQNRGEEIGAYTSMARALVAQGRASDARDAVHKALGFADLHEFPAIELPLTILDARAKSTAAKPGSAGKVELAEAVQELQSAIHKAHQLGLYVIECDGRLALGELEMKLDPATGRAQLSRLTNETHDRGFELYASQARQIMTQGSAPAASGKSAH